MSHLLVALIDDIVDNERSENASNLFPHLRRRSPRRTRRRFAQISTLVFAVEILFAERMEKLEQLRQDVWWRRSNALPANVFVADRRFRPTFGHVQSDAERSDRTRKLFADLFAVRHLVERNGTMRLRRFDHRRFVLHDG